MLWWNKQTTAKKIFYAIGAISFVSGLTFTKQATVIGLIIFLSCVFIALYLPEKESIPKKIQKESNPQFSQKENRVRFIFSIFSLILFLICLYYFCISYLNNNFGLALITGSITLMMFSSFIYLNPKLYNQVFLRNQIVPNPKHLTIDQLFGLLSQVETPFGLCMLSRVPNIKEPVCIYRIIDYHWIVYIQTKSDDFIIQAEKILDENTNIKEDSRVILFTNDLTYLIGYIENANKIPDTEDVYLIFKNLI